MPSPPAVMWTSNAIVWTFMEVPRSGERVGRTAPRRFTSRETGFAAKGPAREAASAPRAPPWQRPHHLFQHDAGGAAADLFARLVGEAVVDAAVHARVRHLPHPL